MSNGQRLRRLLWFGAAAAIAAAVACSGSGVQSPTAASGTSASSGSTPGNGNTPTPTGGGMGTLTVSIKDSPFSDAKALLVTFSEVSVHTSTGGWETLPFADAATVRVCDLKRLVQAEDVLGVGTLAAGHYTQIRLAVSDVKLYFSATTSKTGPVCDDSLTLSDPEDLGVAVDVPPDKLMLNREFDVPSGGATKILLDFDGDKSIHQLGNGKYKMQPVIGIVSVQ